MSKKYRNIIYIITKEKVTSYITVLLKFDNLNLVVDNSINFRSGIHGFRSLFDLFLAVCPYVL